MVNCKQQFNNSTTAPLSTIYNGKKVVAGDEFPIKDREILIITTEKTNSSYRQGFCFEVEGYLKFQGKILKKGKRVNLFLWENKEPYELQFFTTSSHIFIQNAWVGGFDKVNDPACYVGGREWLMHDHWGGAGMIVEEIENGRRYYCNDGECDDDFDDIIFTVTRKQHTKN